MSPIEVLKPESRAGRRAVDRLVCRGETVLDAKTLSRAEKIVRDVRRKGDRALLDYALRLDGASAESVAGLALSPLAGDAADGAGLPAGFVEALERAIVAVERFHAPQARDRLPAGGGGGGAGGADRASPAGRPLRARRPGELPLDRGDDRGARPHGRRPGDRGGDPARLLPLRTRPCATRSPAWA